jgi:hypothetical protein
MSISGAIVSVANSLNPNLMMMQPAQDWNGRDAARLLASEKRRVLANERLPLRCGVDSSSAAHSVVPPIRVLVTRYPDRFI